MTSPKKTANPKKKPSKKEPTLNWAVETAEHLARWAKKITPRRIALIRRSHRLDQATFARRVGVTEAKIAKWEAGTSQPTRTQKHLLVILWKGASMRAAAAQRNQFMNLLKGLEDLGKDGKRKSLSLVFNTKTA